MRTVVIKQLKIVGRAVILEVNLKFGSNRKIAGLSSGQLGFRRDRCWQDSFVCCLIVGLQRDLANQTMGPPQDSPCYAVLLPMYAKVVREYNKSEMKML